MTYQEYIDNIRALRDNTRQDGIYMEQHHIIPRCLGGLDNSENLIWLLPEEHYNAHRLLALEHKDNHQLQSAWWLMSIAKSNNQQRYEVTAEEYAEAKRAKSQSMKTNNPALHFTEEHKRKISESLKGIKRSEEQKELNRQRTIEYLQTHQHPSSGKKREDVAKEVINIETQKIFRTIEEAADAYNLTPSNISKCCHGSVCTAGGFHWQFTNSDCNCIKQNSKFKPVIYIEKNIKFDSATLAAQYFNTNKSKITYCCQNNKEIVPGAHIAYIKKEKK